ncbi:hypothetical protein [Dongia sp.]|uniref:hypothetical protein n=1 Tax=Dongia sp. TaxID=1977262 RepID=UPI0035B108B0
MFSKQDSRETRRAFIRQVLARLDKHPAQLYWAIDSLKAEPKAKHRRLRSSAKICIEDVEVYSNLLKQEFPELIYFFANYKTGTPTPSKFSDAHPIILYGDLLQAVKAALDVERDRPPFNGPNFNRPNIYCRWPWPDEIQSADPERLIGGRDEASDVFRLALQYRDDGRWFTFHYKSDGYVDPRQPNLRYALSASERGKLPADRYPEMAVLSGAETEFFACYDLNDSETTAFAKRAHALWRRIATKDVAVYDPVEREIVDLENWRGKHWRQVGKKALEGALATPARYVDFALTPMDGRSDGPALMIGPKSKKPDPARRHVAAPPPSMWKKILG